MSFVDSIRIQIFFLSSIIDAVSALKKAAQNKRIILSGSRVRVK